MNGQSKSNSLVNNPLQNGQQVVRMGDITGLRRQRGVPLARDVFRGMVKEFISKSDCLTSIAIIKITLR
jgi:hypothetical protein